MKRIIILVLLVILGALSAAELNAASEDPKDVYSEDVYSETEFQEVREFTEEFSKQFDNFPEGEINSGYKLYAMDPGAFSSFITSDAPFLQLAKKEWIGCDRPYAWILPVGEINYCDLQHIDGEWVLGFTLNNYDAIMSGLPEGCEWAPGIVNLDAVQDILRQTEAQGEKLTGEQLVFIVAETDTTFFAFRTNAETYLIAFPWRPDLTGFKSGACYTAQEAKDILDKTYPVIYADERTAGEPLSRGGAASEYKRNDFENVTEWLLKEEALNEEKNKAAQSINNGSEAEEEILQKPGEDGWVEYECDGICFSAPEDWKTGCVPGTARISFSEQSRSEISIKVYHEDQRDVYEWMGYQLYDDPDEEAEAFFKANARMPESMEKFEYDLNGLHFRAYCVNNLEYYDRTKGSDEEPQNLSLLYLVFSDGKVFGNIEVWLLEEDLINYRSEILRMLFSFSAASEAENNEDVQENLSEPKERQIVETEDLSVKLVMDNWRQPQTIVTIVTNHSNKEYLITDGPCIIDKYDHGSWKWVRPNTRPEYFDAIDEAVSISGYVSVGPGQQYVYVQETDQKILFHQGHYRAVIGYGTAEEIPANAMSDYSTKCLSWEFDIQ